jgi:hypothetical protein
LVPDVFPDPCKRHDDCYGTCGVPKQFCDDQFLADMSTRCAQLGLQGLGGVCFAIARVYFKAVRDYGGSAYDNAQENTCSCH